MVLSHMRCVQQQIFTLITEICASVGQYNVQTQQVQVTWIQQLNGSAVSFQTDTNIINVTVTVSMVLHNNA